MSPGFRPAADVDGGGRGHLAVLNQPELGGAAADVDVEDALALLARHPRRARAVGGEHRFHVMARAGADEIAALLGDERGDCLRILAPQRLAGQDHHAGVDVGRIDAGGRIGLVDDGAELGAVDPLLARIGRERDRRLKQGLARDHVIAAGELLAEPAQVDAREDDLGAGRADVDADRRERHMVRDPDRILLERRLVGKIVVVIGEAVMGMREVEPIGVVRERMRLLVLWLVGLGHSRTSIGAASLAALASEIGFTRFRHYQWAEVG